MNQKILTQRLQKLSFRVKEKPIKPLKVLPFEETKEFIQEILKTMENLQSRLDRMLIKNDELSSAYYTPTYDEAEIIKTIKRKLSKWNRMIQYLEGGENDI